jgi:hypothetical protein|tara:strand:- start:1879 stop:2154 length:276 start_codon:yes stop_codon:yes gene_type:complete
MVETKTTEHNKLIATRVPPGDKWILVDDKKKVVHETLTDALEAFFKATGNKCEFRLAPLDSKLYAIQSHEEEIIPEAPKEYSIYGDFRQGV